MNEKPTNPKDAIAGRKLPLHLVPDSVLAFASLAFAEGMLKYGANNWAAAGVRASVYLGAMKRHQAKFSGGEWADEKTGVPHLASIIACAGILLDARFRGIMIDDRPPLSPMADLIDELEGTFTHLRDLFADHHPRHWTIADQIPSETLP
ncbi:hypothetical protein DFO45_2311 [Azorhizobium sp. AG788]|uniref:dATP/dGTP diphosphohydrolase domain-containing protein n=1 Tax=Azorhizobium sp. AG788 TaxID=2183897 RepID=UPI00105DE99E|nr:dATP/dGTP diphosphohydrolase domain-containing protein [Azorhizobium sp. AG788]TDT94561.1 hypothetical protein DFO45_2311 [Azorhizobium sp. AG788]